MGILKKHLLPAHFENEDVQISAELCSNITIHIVGLAKGEITIMSGNEDMIQIRTSVQAKESILKNAAALEPLQDGNEYSYTIHTPLEERLDKFVTFQVLVTIPRQLDSLESFTIKGCNIEVAIGNIGHTFIRHLNISSVRGETTIDNFYGECATISNTLSGGISGSYSLARLYATAASGKINSKVHLLNTDDLQPAPRVVCQTANHRIALDVDGSDLFGPFTVEAKTQCAPLEAKLLMAPGGDQRLLGNFINFNGPTRVKLSKHYQGRIETRTHYGRILLEEPTFVKKEGAVLTALAVSDRIDRHGHVLEQSHPHQQHHHHPSQDQASAAAVLALSTISSSASSHGTAMSWEDEFYSSLPQSPSSPLSPHSPFSPRYPAAGPLPSHSGSLPYPDTFLQAGPDSGSDRAESTTGSFSEGLPPPSPAAAAGRRHSPRTKVSLSKTEKQRKKDEERDIIVTRELIGTIGTGPGLVMARNSSGDIALELF